MIPYPQIDRVALEVGPLSIHWYGLMYLLGIGSAWLLAKRRLAQFDPSWDNEKVTDLVFWCSVGVIVGGRFGYVLFYNLHQYLAEPALLLEVWKGGMSFHGGMIGVSLAIFWFARKQKKPFFSVLDFVAPLVPIGLGAGRIGNFINAELWGKATDLPWAMVFPLHSDPLQVPRHPSQLYEFALEGVVLFVILWAYSAKPRPTMAVSGIFALFYGIFRFIVEFFRLPDSQLGYLAFGWLTMGQLLCLPMIICGVALTGWAYVRRHL